MKGGRKLKWPKLFFHFYIINRKKLHFAFAFVFVFVFVFFCSVLSGKAEITLQGAYHHLHFVGLTSQGIFLFHLTKKGIVITIKKLTVVKYIHIHSHTHTHLYVCLCVLYVKLSSI